MKAAEEMKREQKEVKLRMILQDYHRRNNYELQQAVNDILALDALPPAEGAKKVQWSGYGELGNISQKPLQPTAEGAEQLIRVRNILQDFYRRGDYELEQAAEDIMRIFTQQPTAEGAEEILASIVESLGEPINIHNHVFEIRPYTVEHKTEWWIFHKEVSSGEPLKQWLGKFATLHAQKIADKMVEERIILDEEMAEPVQDALYATGRFTIDECNVLTEGILMYIKERGIINLKSRER